MSNEKQMLETLRTDALYAYLELCNASGSIPDKGIYDGLMKEKDVKNLELYTSMIEKGHGALDKIKKTFKP